MKRLTFRERESVSFGPGGMISEPEAESIAKMVQILPRGAVTWGHKTLKFGPFCGVFQTDLLTIEVLPKIDAGDDRSDDMRGLLISMLAIAGQLGSRRLPEARLAQQQNHLLDVFIEDFCCLVRAALKKGGIARYEEMKVSLNAVRGRLELTEHLRANAFDRSRLLCSFDERSFDNKYNQTLKEVLRILHRFAMSALTRSVVAGLLNRFDEVSDRKVNVHHIKSLSFDRTIRYWEEVFVRAGFLLSGLFPDVRTGAVDGSALMFNMEKLFERVLGIRVRQLCAMHGGNFSVGLQGPIKKLATSAFELQPDITVDDGSDCVAIFDAKWKRLDLGLPNSGVAGSDAYQMNAYASRYRCKRLALVYPASRDLPSGKIDEFELETLDRPVLEVITVDVQKLASGNWFPKSIERLITNL
ncbi:restriction endonuclease [Brucella sp. NBRC 12950]|nr:restriction endonuclease [Brucella sp. NBRC 12950]